MFYFPIQLNFTPISRECSMNMRSARIRFVLLCQRKNLNPFEDPKVLEQKNLNPLEELSQQKHTSTPK